MTTTTPWGPDELHAFCSSLELQISTVRKNGSFRAWTPIWVAATSDEVYVRTWHRRTTGWYGDAVARKGASIRLLGLERTVEVDDVGVTESGTRERVDAAYVMKYGPGEMSDDETAARTLRLRKRD